MLIVEGIRQIPCINYITVLGLKQLALIYFGFFNEYNRKKQKGGLFIYVP